MSKKLTISLIVLFVVVATVLILFWTLFALSSVTVDFQSNLIYLNLTEKEIVEAGDFHYGACVLFDGKKDFLQKINEKAKEDKRFAYIRVVNIETVFPNKYVIHVAERERLFAVENGGQVLICDRDLRVLEIESDFDKNSEKPILLKGMQIKNADVKEGDFLQVEQTFMLKFFAAFLQNNRSYNEIVEKFDEVKVSSYADEFTNSEYYTLEMTSLDGRKFTIKNPDFAFANKVALMYSVESALFAQNTDSDGNILDSEGKQIYLSKNENGEYLPYVEGQEGEKIALTYSLLENCQIVIDNLSLTDFVDRTENDIFYFLQEI